MNIRELARDYKAEIEDGICWVAIWKRKRSWCAVAFYMEDGSYNDGYTFSAEDMEAMKEIIAEDSNAIMINGYYTNCGTDENETVPVSDIISGIEWNYYNHYNTLYHFYDGFVIKED